MKPMLFYTFNVYVKLMFKHVDDDVRCWRQTLTNLPSYNTITTEQK